MPRKPKEKPAEKTVEQQRAEYLAREAEAMKEWTQPTKFEPVHNATPSIDREPSDEPAGDDETEEPESAAE